MMKDLTPDFASGPKMMRVTRDGNVMMKDLTPCSLLRVLSSAEGPM
jgi:hypothetical protein